MKKIKLFFAVVCVVACCLQSCNNGKTYAEMKEEEADAINAWILNHDYQVISERDFTIRIQSQMRTSLCCSRRVVFT